MTSPDQVPDPHRNRLFYPVAVFSPILPPPFLSTTHPDKTPNRQNSSFLTKSKNQPTPISTVFPFPPTASASRASPSLIRSPSRLFYSMSKATYQPPDDTPEAPPPSYTEALNLPAPADPPQRPPQQLPRPQKPEPHQPRPQSSQPRPQSSLGLNGPPRPLNTPTLVSYSNNEHLPFEFPKRWFCKKCKNTGYKKDGKMCLDCWRPLYLKNNAWNPNPQLPFKYPKNFICEKCYNHGIKRKNGKTCKDCYERFAKRNNYSVNPPGMSGSYHRPVVAPPPMPVPMGMPGSFGPPPVPMRVAPGDPRLGGTLCGNCRGTGQTWFLLDSELCHVCGGLGRLLNRY